MTHDSLKRLILMGIQRHSDRSGTNTYDALSGTIADVLEPLLTLQSSGQPEPLTTVAPWSEADEAERASVLPPSPAASVAKAEEPSVIIMPGTPAAAAPQEITQLPRLRTPEQAAEDKKPAWQMPNLIITITKKTPETLSFERTLPDGSQQEITLTRNVIPNDALELARLQYAAPGVGADQAVIHDFSLFDAKFDLTVIMSELEEQAKIRYQPRPEQLASRTPVKTGTLAGFDVNAPHDSV